MPADPVPGIDVESVLRRARARRRPRVIAAISGGVLAVAAIATPVVAVSLPRPGVASVSDLGSGAGGSAPRTPEQPSPDAGSAAGSGETSPGCGAPLAPLPPAADGLVATVTPLTAASGARDVPVQVTVTNTGSQRVSGSTTAGAALTLSRDGIVVGLSGASAPQTVVRLDLEPGASASYVTTIDAVGCSGAAAPPGDYFLSATIPFAPDDDPASAVPVTGPAAAMTINKR